MKDNKPVVIIEAKFPNSKEMITQNDLYKKAFYEAIFYFMVERGKNNHALFHIIITDFNNWFVFDAKDFDRLFWRNSTIKKIYTTYKDINQLAVNTYDVYQALEKALPNLKKDLLDLEEIQAAHFNFKLQIKEKELVAIYKLLSADGLLKEFKANEANSLDKNFYNELLYILGLEETKESGKKVIGQAKAAQNGTLYENISNKLAQYQKPNDFESVIKLIITWVNRILFLKLLESQISNWTNAKNDKFLHPSKLDQYDQLETLFFEVLAKPIGKRTVGEYNHVPYLNSSLFEIHPDEKTGITISNLADGLSIEYFNKTVLTDNKQRKTGKVSTLPYLLEFLDAYNFANDSDDEVTNNAKSLISASVLGLIFEKINGYKDGSFYTPSFITMYMARETITKAVIDKFNVAYDWQCKTLIDLHNKEPNIAEANALINSITICDPAVGSGHFLVSALNEMLFIKAEIGVLVDAAGRKLTGYSFSIESDELIIKDDQGNIFEYKKDSDTKTRLQKTLFKEKQNLIENCLFGVDINPNSVNICRLRLWIELLKNAYYKPDGTLDTLPNIDINIKCGNSLISRFGLADDIKSTTIKAEIQDYKTQVKQYKENIGSKQQVLQAIDNVKVKFKTDLKENHAATQKFNDALVQYVAKFSFDDLNDEQFKIARKTQLLGKQTSFLDENVDQTEKIKFKKLLDSAWSAVEEIENGKIYQNAFEWRFEFPEVLNEEGNFVGFDVVIGNPPYVFARENFTASEKAYYTKNYKLSGYQINLYILFVERALNIIRPDAKFAFIVPNNWLTINSAKSVREFILNYSDITIVNFLSKVFEDANVDTSILMLANNNKTPITALYEYQLSDFNLIAEMSNTTILNGTDALINIAAFKDDANTALLAKIQRSAKRLDAIADVKVGLGAYGIDKGIPIQTISMIEKRIYHSLHKEGDDWFPYLEGRDVSRYNLGWSGEYLKYGAHLREPRRDWGLFSTPRILVRQIPAQPPYSIHACFTEDVILNDRNSMNIVNITEHPLYVLALLNSKLMTYWFIHKFGKLQRGIFPQFKVNELGQFPFAITDNQQLFVEKASTITATKQLNQDTRQLEQELDAMVYALYGLSDDEIKLIEAANT